MKKARKPVSPSLAARRRAIWKHNSFFGFAQLGKRNMNTIMQSETATEETKGLASDAWIALDRLNTSLKTRKDQQ